MSTLAECTEGVVHRIIVVKENRSCFVIQNPGGLHVDKIRIDGCLINDNRERCDWVFVVCHEYRQWQMFYVELKGADFNKAISQIESTLRETREWVERYAAECYIVTTRVPKHGPKVRRKAMEFYSRNGIPLYVKNVRSEVRVQGN